jgi:hypothetical protein
VALRSSRHGSRQRYQEKKYGVEKHRDAQHEPARGEDQGRTLLAEKTQGGTHNALGGAASEQAGADN